MISSVARKAALPQIHLTRSASRRPGGAGSRAALLLSLALGLSACSDGDSAADPSRDGDPADDSATSDDPADDSATSDDPADDSDDVAPTDDAANTDDAASDDSATEDAATDDAASDDAASDDAPSDDAASDDAPSDDAPSDDAPSDDAPSDDAASDDLSAADDAASDDSASDDTGDDTGDDTVVADDSTLDPAPLFPRVLSGKVPVDGPYVVLRVPDGGSGSNATYRIEVLETQTGTLYLAAEGSTFNSDVQLTPKRDTLFFDGLTSTSSAERSVMYLEDDGFVPPKLPPGYSEETIGTFFVLWEWSEDGRFGAAWREPTSGEAFIDIIDTHSGGRWGSVPVADAGAMYWFGGHTFAYNSEDPGAWRKGMIAVMDDGLWDYTLPTEAGRWTLGNDGRFYYTLVDGETSLLFAQAPAGDPVAIPVPEGFTLGALLSAEPGGTSVLSEVAQSDGSTHLYRIHADGSAPERVGDLSGSTFLYTYQTLDHEWQLLEMTEDGVSSVVLIRLSDLATTVLTTFASELQLSVGRLGNHFFHLVEGSPVTLVGFDQGSPVSVPVEGSETQSYAGCLGYPEGGPIERTIMKVSDASLVMVDLGEATPRIVGKLDASEAGSTLGCPVWSKDGRSFAFAEQGEAVTRIFRGTWSEAGPSTPELVYESAENASPIGLR